MNVSVRALNRFGLGARIGEAERLDDPRGWLEAQLDGGDSRIASPEVDDSVSSIVAQRAAARAGDPEATRGVRRRIREFSLAEARQAVRSRLQSPRPFAERLVSFWSNHLCVSGAAKLPTRLLAGAYEREAIRPHVLGRFDEMVLASARHPAMSTYLDNAQSIGPDSALARMARRRRRGRPSESAPIGLNENYARELLELHTLGVDGGYAEADIREAARVLTGWTVTGLRAPGRAVEGGGEIGFVFEERIHDPGAKMVLGRQYAGGGEAEGTAMIRDLCRHPATADFVATKLVRHFVADDPPDRAVRRVAGVFRDTDGDLKEVARVLVHLPEVWLAENHKFRTPQEWAIAMLRALEVDEVPPTLFTVFQNLRQPLWAPPSPKGYGDTVAEWADPDALMNRAELARTVASTVRRRGGRRGSLGRGVPVGALVGVVEAAEGDSLGALAGDDSIPIDERLALAFAGPAFQWR